MTVHQKLSCARQVPVCASPLWLAQRSKRIPGPLLLPIAVSLVVPAFHVALSGVLGLAWLCTVFAVPVDAV